MKTDPKPCPWCRQVPAVKNGKVKCINLACPVQPKLKAWYVAAHIKVGIDEWNSMLP